MRDNFNKIIDEDLAYIMKADLPWHELEGKNILIAGANGALPAYMVETILYLNKNLLKNKAKIFALVRNIEKAQKKFGRHKDDKNLEFVIQDVCDKINLSNDLDYIIHAASQASPKYYGSDPVGTLLPNVLGTYNLLELAREKSLKGFIFFSSGAVYGPIGDNQQANNEKKFGILDPFTIESCYPESKRMGENMCQAWLSQYKIPIKVVRPFHTYGPGVGLNDGRVFADFVRNIVNNEDITMNSDGSAKRTFCYLADAAIAFFTVLLKGNIGEAYNVSGDKLVSISELAGTLVNMFPEKNLKIKRNEILDKNYLKTAASGHLPDISKIVGLGWKPVYSIEEGFRRMIKSFEQ
ncbi:MAG: NAD-dependent epimerase/dehydratase family protein [Patescibacteria group bacterium]|jgi:nucleoside-diphosphate-sugar epimerase